MARRVALLGALNSLSQITLKATMPGVPDFYQGTEFWDLSLVDPDNRRPVDFAERADVLADVETPDWDRLAQNWPDGHLKLAWTRHLLQLRNELADVFTHGDYQPLEVSGPHRDHVIAFARRHGGDAAITVVTKSLAPMSQGGRAWPRADDFDGALNLGGYSVEGFAAEVPLSQLFRQLPVAVLRGESRGGDKAEAEARSRVRRSENAKAARDRSRTAWRMSCRQPKRSVPFVRAGRNSREIPYRQAYVANSACVFTASLCAAQQQRCTASTALGEQQVTAIADRDLRDLGKSLQQPRQRHFQPHVIVGDIDMARRRLPQRADAKHHAVTLPSLFVDLQHGNARRGPRQSGLQPARGFVAAKPVRNRNDERCRHRANPLKLTQLHVIADGSKGRFTSNFGDPKMELS